MQKMSGIELSFVAAELAPLQGKRIAKIRKTAEGIFLFKIGAGEMLFEPGVRLHLTRQVHQATEAPDGFVALLRKQLEGKTEEKIAQYGTDRILEITTRSKERLAFELFRKGNLIYIGEGGRIISCLQKEEAGGRKIARDEPYAYPPATSFVQKMPEKTAFLVQENEKGEPASFSLDAQKGGKGFPSFSEALDFYYANQKEESAASAAAQQKLGKLQERLESQQKTLAKMEAEQGEAKGKGDAIYQNFDALDSLLSLVRGMKKMGASDEEIEKALWQHKARLKGAQVEVEL
ncbi:Uncharacterised protein [uncultured archaeon]|nr:Uncharacterised protein [uncultured archaeon]